MSQEPKEPAGTLSRLSSELGISRATVSKALRHCSGVDAETRQRVLRAAHGIEVLPPSKNCAVYCILPDTPSYFWKEMRRGITEGMHAHGLGGKTDFKLNIYSGLRDEESVLDYLEEADAMHARCIIIAAAVTDRIRKLLTVLGRPADRLILLLSEYGNIPNAFYIGGDAYADGATLSRRLAACHETTPFSHTFILTTDGNDNIRTRVRGFTETARTIPHLPHPTQIVLDPARFAHIKTRPAYLASCLASAAAECGATDGTREQNFALYVPLGITNLSLVPEKAGLSSRCAVFCHDAMPDPQNRKTAAMYAAVCMQDVYAQGYAAVGYAHTYLTENRCPDTKRIIVPSLFYDSAPMT